MSSDDSEPAQSSLGRREYVASLGLGALALDGGFFSGLLGGDDTDALAVHDGGTEVVADARGRGFDFGAGLSAMAQGDDEPLLVKASRPQHWTENASGELTPSTNGQPVRVDELARTVGGEVAYTDTGGQTIDQSVWDPVAFDTVRLDERGEWDDANNEFVVVNDGVYLAQAQVYWDSITTAGTFRVKLFKNGASFGAVQHEMELATGESATCGPTMALFEAVKGDSIQAAAWHNGDTAGETIMGHASANGFRVIRLG